MYLISKEKHFPQWAQICGPQCIHKHYMTSWMDSPSYTDKNISTIIRQWKHNGQNSVIIK